VIFLSSDKFIRLVKLTRIGPLQIKLADVFLKLFSLFAVIILLLGVAFITFGIHTQVSEQNFLRVDLSQTTVLILLSCLVPAFLYRAVGFAQFFAIFFWLGVSMEAFVHERSTTKSKKLLKFETFAEKSLFPVLFHWFRLLLILGFATLFILFGFGLFIHRELAYFYTKWVFNSLLGLAILTSIFSGYFMFKKLAERGLFTIDLFRPFILSEIRSIIIVFISLILFVVSLCIVMFWIIPQLLCSGVDAPGSPYESLRNTALSVCEFLPWFGPPSALAIIVSILVFATWLFAIPYLRLFGVKAVSLSLIAFAATWGIQELTTRLSPFFPRRVMTYIVMSFFVAILTYVLEKKKDNLLRHYRGQTARCSNPSCNKLISINFPYCPFCRRKIIRDKSAPRLSAKSQ